MCAPGEVRPGHITLAPLRMNLIAPRSTCICGIMNGSTTHTCCTELTFYLSLSLALTCSLSVRFMYFFSRMWGLHIFYECYFLTLHDYTHVLLNLQLILDLHTSYIDLTRRVGTRLKNWDEVQSILKNMNNYDNN